MNQPRRRQLLIAAGSAAVLPHVARAQSTKKMGRVGWLATSAQLSMSLENFRAAMRERGWIEGENYSIEVRSGTAAQGAGLATELLKAKVDLIVAPGGLFFTARSVTGDTPLIFGINGDPVVAKIVASYSRPGGNVTGVSSLSAELSGKRLELLKEAAPGLTRFAALANQTHPGVQTEFEATHAAAKRLGIDVKWFPVYAPAEIPAAFEAMTRENSQALAAIPDNMINLQAQSGGRFFGFAGDADDLWLGGVRRSRQSAELWAHPARVLPSLRALRGQDSERGETSGPSGRAAHRVRVRRQHENREGAGPEYPAVAARAGRPSHRVVCGA